jgi:hypothetical protein
VVGAGTAVEGIVVGVGTIVVVLAPVVANLIIWQVQVLLAVPEDGGSIAFKFSALVLFKDVAVAANLKLGLPSHVTHLITPQSPL